MANVTHFAKPGSKWMFNNLVSYNISLNEMDPCSFFGLQVGENSFWKYLTLFMLQELPQPKIDQELLKNIDVCSMKQDDHITLMLYLNCTMIPENGESAIINFAYELLEGLDFIHQDQTASLQVNLLLSICGKDRCAKANVCIIDHSPKNDHILLLV